ncbi:peptidoglycan D,D-transpeptidase FtsI family protein [Sphingomonas immobilis]|uniref:Penicillin-binding protein 2 n=1 Tax=Sphingomonas immobilis TaxID=3063997 RepID=A0ABT8ZWV2_9SPHN|nr:penicillin-binding protein 2 [Sphingomonas sp. CA1-15]MDO7842023.1 penicillin-binding protein 2 [Sphingomonas sp. CA1-15]
MSTFVARPVPQRRTSGQRHALIATAHMRLSILMLFLGAGFLTVIGKIALLGFISSPAGAQGAAVNPIVRSDILDRNGEPLARTIDAWTVAVRPGEILGDRRFLADKLAEILPGRDSDYYYQRLTMKVKFTYLDRHASPAAVNAIHDLGEPGLVFAQEPERLYPQSTLAAHALGYIGPIGDDPTIAGRAGIERAFDDRLTAPGQRGKPIVLSIDSRVQAAMDSELGRAMASFKARTATGIVLDVHTGEIIAMSSLPVYNPNKVGGTSADAMRNNVTQSVYELGSTFKPITMANAIETGVVPNMAKRFDATVPLKVGGYTIHDDRGDEQKRWLNIPETLIYSSNIATARIADELGEDREKAMYEALGLHGRPLIEVKEKGHSIWPTYWSRTAVMTTAYGHGMAVTPLQLANAYATLVNGGIFRPTTLLKVAPGKAPAGRRVFSEATSARMRQLLRMIVLMGTGKKAEAPGYRVGGKTGTAEVAGAGGYSKKVNVSTFAGVFPMDNPRYVVVAMLDSPIGNAESFGLTTAAWTAAPVVSRVIARTGAMLGVMPDANRDIDVSDLTPLVWRAPGKDSTKTVE